MPESVLDALLGSVEGALAHNAVVLVEADRVLAGTPYGAVVLATRADVTARAQERARARTEARALAAGRTRRSNIRL